jgi:hypothetical protein
MGNLVDVAYIDFSKAFDTVSHKKLLYKLSTFGISNHLLSWLEGYLSSRKFRVKVNQSFSRYFEVSSGVPQGSNLGPTLFIIYINGLIDEINAVPNVYCKIFADDVKLYVHRNFHDSDVPSGYLQAALLKVEGWAKMWQLPISVAKCCLLRLGNTNTVVNYFLNGELLPIVSSAKDLGVFVDKNLKSNKHCKYVASRAYRTTNILFRCFLTTDIDVLLRAYVTYVRPQLEYASPVWSPSYVTDIDMLENTQRYFTRRLFCRLGLDSLPYKERLRRLTLEPLELRRLHSDLVMVYKILSKKADGCQKLFTLSSVLHTRGHTRKLEKQRFNSNVLKHCFSSRIINVWNSLPASVKDKPLITAKNCDEFKKLLNYVNLEPFLTYDRRL